MIKVLLDHIFAFLGLCLLSPVLLLIALLIWIERPNQPVLFRQPRVGKDGALFNIVKFRTMESGAKGGTVSVAGDSRITPLGSWLRRLKLDELPELWNVFIGEMSFVVPRPDVPGYVDQLKGEDREILRLRPGITGPASLKYRNEEVLLASVDDPQRYNDEVLFPDKVRINRYYLHHSSLRTDVKLVLATVFGQHLMYGGERI